MTAETDLSLARCQDIADRMRDSALAGTLLRPNLQGLAPLDAIEYEQRRAELREAGLLDTQNAWTRLGRRVQAFL